MHRLHSLILALAISLPIAALAALKPGDPAPPFTTPAALAGKAFDFDLSQALKQGPVVLYFYPKAFTRGCTIEANCRFPRGCSPEVKQDGGSQAKPPASAFPG